MNNEEKLIQDNLTGKNHEGIYPNSPVHFLTARSIIGDKVESTRGERLGNIKDIMLDIVNGGIEYVVLEYKFLLGFKKKLFAVPFNALKLNSRKKAFVVSWNREMIKNAPGFNQKHWPYTNKHYDVVTHYWGPYLGVNSGSDLT